MTERKQRKSRSPSFHEGIRSTSRCQLSGQLLTQRRIKPPTGSAATTPTLLLYSQSPRERGQIASQFPELPALTDHQITPHIVTPTRQLSIVHFGESTFCLTVTSGRPAKKPRSSRIGGTAWRRWARPTRAKRTGDVDRPSAHVSPLWPAEIPKISSRCRSRSRMMVSACWRSLCQRSSAWRHSTSRFCKAAWS